MMPAAMMAATQAPAVSLELEAEQHRPRAFRRLEQAHGDLGDDAELAFRADDQSEEIVAGRIEARAADIDDLAVHQHHADAEHVIGGDAVFQAMRAAGIGGDIAADGAGDLARRVGRVKEAVARDRIGDAGIGDAGLDMRHAVGEVDGEHLAHAREAQHDRVFERQGPAGERGAGPARHDLDVVLVAEAEDGARNCWDRRQRRNPPIGLPHRRSGHRFAPRTSCAQPISDRSVE